MPAPRARPTTARSSRSARAATTRSCCAIRRSAAITSSCAAPRKACKSPTSAAAMARGWAAFTGADQRRVGAFERAAGGTVLLDEIGELPLDVQPALLGVLERRAFQRVGGGESIGVDVRVLAATHRDLRAEVNAGRFRADLYYRLAVLQVRMPPLRQRAEDLPLLIEHILQGLGAADSDAAAIVRTREFVADLARHAWPG